MTARKKPAPEPEVEPEALGDGTDEAGTADLEAPEVEPEPEVEVAAPPAPSTGPLEVGDFIGIGAEHVSRGDREGRVDPESGLIVELL